MGSYLLTQVENMDDPAHDKPESLSQPNEFPRTPTWVITDWNEPESKAANAPRKFSIRDVWSLANICLVICLFVGWFILFIEAIDSPFQRGHELRMAYLIVLVCLVLRLLR